MVDPLDPMIRDMKRIGRLLEKTIRPTIVVCPICGTTVEIPQYDSITRTDALKGHISSIHFGGEG